MKKIAVVTMARNDEFFLNRWVAYYGKEFGQENLFVYLDGEDQPVPQFAGKANIIRVKHIAEQLIKADKQRSDFLSQKAAELFETYDLVIGVDADEFLAADTKLGKSLAEYLSEIEINTSVSGLGLDVGQNMNCETQLDESQLFLAQRSYAFVSSRYTKSNVISKPLHWGSGFHRVKGHNFKIDENLYLFHFGCVDYKMIMQRFNDKDRTGTGWTGHIKKRLRTISFITKKRAKDGDKWLSIARIFQTLIRPVYAMNKPSMACWRLVVKLPERFGNIV
ncbi:MAG: glycosyltransferase family 2 protein [Prevotellaceae bacterium]|jgi:hypothetical protein|nr:glycosyltransferase family 2 protein [Prevotellaceae bacterium]